MEIGFGFFYLIPVCIASWWGGQKQAAAIAVACAATLSVLDIFGGHVYSHPAIAYWNAAMLGGIFLAISLLLCRLKVALEREKEASRLKSDMLSLVSHEFSNLLACITMSLTMLREGERGELTEHRKGLYDILARVQKSLAHAVENFLNHARLESGKFALNIRETLLRDVIRGVVAALEPFMAKKQIELRMDFPPAPIALRADPDALALVMSNLIGNAVKYSPERSVITIGISWKGPQQPGDRVQVSVQDQGIGISREDRELIFSGFYRTASGKNQAKGFGVGLKVAQGLLESHGSRLEIESEPGRGSLFFFSLPAWEGRSSSAAS